MTASVLYADDGLDWAAASPLEMRIEAEYLRARLDAYPKQIYRDELARIEAAAQSREIKL